MAELYGKYRGTVVNNIDPLKRGRLMLEVPDASPTPTTWALPCVPVAGPQMGMLSIPPIGAGVWAEFEQGDLDRPIWTGCWWGSAAELPALAQAHQPPTQGFALQTMLQNGIAVSDLPGPAGGILLKTTAGATVAINDTEIVIQNAKGASISMVGPALTISGSPVVINGTPIDINGTPVNINEGALTVT